MELRQPAVAGCIFFIAAAVFASLLFDYADRAVVKAVRLRLRMVVGLFMGVATVVAMGNEVANQLLRLTEAALSV